MLGGLVATSEDEVVTVEYSAMYLESLIDGVASVKYSMSISGVDAMGYGYISFQWDGGEDPLSEAERCLKLSIENIKMPE